MKNIIIIALLLSISIIGNAQKDGYSEFYKTYKTNDNIINFKLPAGLMSMFIDKEEEPELKLFLSKINNLRFFISEDSKELIPNLKKSISDEVYKDLMIINDGGNKITFTIRDSEKSISEVIMLIEEKESFFVMSFNGNFTEKDVKKFIKSVNSESVLSSK